MIYGSNDDRKKYIQAKIDAKRGLIKYFPVIKNVVQDFDGKVYNCKLDRAIREATVNDQQPRGGCYCHIAYNDWIEICAYIGSESFDFLYFKKSDLKDGKRIDAAVWLDNINSHYAKLMQDITRLERDLEVIDDTLSKVEILKKQIETLVEPLTWTTRDAYNIGRITI